MRGGFACDVKRVELSERGIEILGVEHDERRDSPAGVDLGDAK